MKKKAQEREERGEEIYFGDYRGCVVEVYDEDYRTIGYYWEASGNGWWESGDFGYDYFEDYDEAEESLMDFLKELDRCDRYASRRPKKAMKKKAQERGFGDMTLDEKVEAVKALFHSLARSQGSYGRLIRNCEEEYGWDWLYDFIEEYQPKDAVDVIMALEGGYGSRKAMKKKASDGYANITFNRYAEQQKQFRVFFRSRYYPYEGERSMKVWGVSKQDIRDRWYDIIMTDEYRIVRIEAL